MLKTEEIRVRDLFVLVEGGIYYLYATTGETTYSCYTSKDLKQS